MIFIISISVNRKPSLPSKFLNTAKSKSFQNVAVNNKLAHSFSAYYNKRKQSINLYASNNYYSNKLVNNLLYDTKCNIKQFDNLRVIRKCSITSIEVKLKHNIQMLCANYERPSTPSKSKLFAKSKEAEHKHWPISKL